MVVKILLPWVTLSATNTSIANHWLDLQQHGETFREKSFNFWEILHFLQSSGWQGLEGFQVGQNLELAEGEDEEGGW